MKILVTGADGQLGRSIYDLSKHSKWNWVFVNRKQLDISNRNQVISFTKKHKPNVIINTAAYTNVDNAENEEGLAFLINSGGVSNLIDSVINTKTKIIHISTDYVFDGTNKIPFVENDKINPQSVYGRSKAEAEKVLLEKIEDRSYIIRTAWLYSEYGHNFVKTMLRLGKEKDKISVVNDQFGTPTYAHDLAAGILSMLKSFEKGVENTSGIYHFANKNTTTWFDFATEIMNLKELDCVVNPIPTSGFPTPAKRPNFSSLNCLKFESIFNFTIRNWKEALAECLSKLEKN